MRNQFKKALLAVGLASDIGALATVTLTSRVAVCYPSDAPGGGRPGEVQSVSSTYGFYTIFGCYAAPPSGYLLDGKTSVSVGMTLASCASYCTGSAFFALQNGNQCLCGSKPPTTANVGSGKCNTGCSAGSTITTSRNTVITPAVSSEAPPPPPTSIVVVSSTNSQGSVIVASSTSTAAGPYYSQACGGRYSDNFGQLWCLQCQTAYFFNDLTTVTVGTFEECLHSCTTYVPSLNVAGGASCVAITWGPRTVGGECYRKYTVTDSRLDPRQDSAYKCDQDVVPPSATSIINTNTGGVVSTGGGSSIINTNTGNVGSTRASTPATSDPNVPATSNPNIPATSNPNVPATSTSRAPTPATSAGNVPGTSNPSVPGTTPPASNPGIPATLISSATTASSINLVEAFQPCPSSDNEQYIDQLGYVYDIKCGCDYQFSDLSVATHQDYFADCLLACSRYVPNSNEAQGASCIGVSWGRPDYNPGANCYLKYRIERIRCGNADFCAAVKHTYTIPSDVISTYRDNTNPTATGPSVAASSAPPVIAPSSSASQPSVVIPSSSTSRPAVASSSSFPPAVLPPSSTQATFNPSNTFAPPQISRTVSCPSQNGSVYTDFWGQTWEVRCGMDILGTNAQAVHADSWEKCLQFCDILGGV
ncbi:MAG: hypothetical protein Q9180_005124, partial [Flavoplaca navasiana]